MTETEKKEENQEVKETPQQNEPVGKPEENKAQEEPPKKEEVKPAEVEVKNDNEKPKLSFENQRLVMFYICHNIPLEKVEKGKTLFNEINTKIGELKKVKTQLVGATDVYAELVDDVKNLELY